MKELVENFVHQLEEAREIGQAFVFEGLGGKTIRNVVITGLGGSGIGGTIAQELVVEDCRVPVLVNKDYFLPKFVDEHTLLIVSSYSGNTEETIHALKIGIERGCEIACVSSGGEISKITAQHKINTILIPGGMPPRACLTYSLTQILYIFRAYNLVQDSFIADLARSIGALKASEPEIKASALDIANKIVNKIAVIYTTSGYEGAAVRIRQQLNENAKMLCWHHVIPEMNHNELVGWTREEQGLSVMFLRNSEDYSRIQKRIEICKGIISKYAASITEVYARGQSKTERTLYFILLGDWISVYIAELRKVDAVEVKVIDYLKGSLAKD